MTTIKRKSQSSQINQARSIREVAGKRANLSTRIKTKVHGKKKTPLVGEGTKSQHQMRLRRKPKQSIFKNIRKDGVLAKPRRSERVEVKGKTTS